MPSTTISYDALKKSIGKEISVKEIEAALFDMGMELEGLEGDALSIEVTAERFDLLSVVGLARALKAYMGLTHESPKYETHHDGYIVHIKKSVSQVRPYTVCAIIKNLHFDDEKIIEMINVQEKLHATLGRDRKRGAIGIYPLESITLPITYLADKPQNIVFAPLGYQREMNALQILSTHETGRSYGHLLEGKDVFPYFKDAKDNVLSLPPIINSERTGRVTEKTTEVFIECSGFDKQHLHELLTHLVTMFADMGGEIYSMTLDYEGGKKEETPVLEPLKKTFSFGSIKKYLGISLDETETKRLLHKMMYDVIATGDVWTVTAPPFRHDLWHEVDIIDDIARAIGFNNLPLTTPSVSTVGDTLPISDLREDLAESLVGLGFLETYTFALTGDQEQITNMNLDTNTSRITIKNGNELQTMLRTSLLPQLLQSLVHNRNRSLPQKIFEGAYIVLPDESKDVKSRNEMHLSAMITHKQLTFTHIRQVLDATLQTIGKKAMVKTANHPSFIEGRCGHVIVDEKIIGVIGEIHPQVLTNFGLGNPVVAFEINIEPLLSK